MIGMMLNLLLLIVESITNWLFPNVPSMHVSYGVVIGVVVGVVLSLVVKLVLSGVVPSGLANTHDMSVVPSVVR